MAKKIITQAPKIGFVSLGCPKALVDSERILTQLRSEGYDISPDYAGSDLVVVNTCGFIDSAVAESLDTIGEALNENGKVIVTGCLGARPEVIMAEHPQVLAISGAAAYQEVMAAVHTHVPKPHEPFVDLMPSTGVKLTPRHYAYLKISEGCNHNCTFCIIPSMRGKLVSRSIGDVMREAKNLVDAGVKELLVVSQDTSAYGVDMKHKMDFWDGRPLKTNLYDMASALGDLGIWTRMHYVYPYPNVDDIIPLMAQGKILPYLDIPFQHASPRILKMMKRPGDVSRLLDRIKKWRDICPELTIRSTFIVGFPGETDEDFEMLMDFLDQAELDRVGCFPYSPVEGAVANDLAPPVADDVKQERWEELMALQMDISEEKMKAKVGRRMTVLVDTIGEQGAIARSAADAPEIDGTVIIKNGAHLPVGEFVEVDITGSDTYDLFAKVRD
ncbi:MAG: 30S ribosomal protein S12 methylthiotransferase RimO [Thiotrichales bacterium]|jgi:ribosomal protein S12 methylthiotransferase|nr:30S ribosomal protein S12 methylthiotransferase RimO [Thiotrichales bacterium]